MARQYRQHGLLTLVRRQGRRKGDSDGRTTIAKNADEVRRIIIADKGGEDNCSGALLVVIQLLKSHIAKRSEIHEGIEAYLKAHPKSRLNPRAMNTLNGYLDRHDNAIMKLVQIIGIDKAPRPTKTLHDLLTETAEQPAQTQQDDQGDTQAQEVPDDRLGEQGAQHHATVDLNASSAEIEGVENDEKDG